VRRERKRKAGHLTRKTPVFGVESAQKIASKKHLQSNPKSNPK
jgi:hypothetical protein